jgi:HlyD family secretion protein
MKIFKVILLITVFQIITGCGNNSDSEIIEASGNIEAINITVSAKVSGEIIQILQDEGTQVFNGDTVLIIDSETFELRITEAIAAKDYAEAQYSLLKEGARAEDVRQAEENLTQAEINLELADKNKERMVNLYESKSITTKQYDDAVANYQIVLARYNAANENLNKIKNLARPEELKQAEANLKRMDANVKLIQKSVNDCYVTSPLNGIIVKKFIEVGESAGVMSSLFQVSDLNVVELVVYVPETELAKVKLNQSAEVQVDTYPDKTYEGKVIYISPEAEFTPKNIQTKEERTKLVFAVKIQIPNPDFELKSGMPADAVIQLKAPSSSP